MKPSTDRADHDIEQRRRLLKALLYVPALGLCMISAVSMAYAATACASSPEWDDFVKHHIQDDGRVVDLNTAAQQSTSESQSYGLFFALVANDRPLFERILHWTDSNLAAGHLGQRLPAWRWGRADDGRWHTLDENPASDSDLWIAYTLIEAGRLWSNQGYAGLGRSVLTLVAQKEIVPIPGLGPMLLPGAVGFVEKGRWRLNPSYLPVQLLRCFAGVDPQGPWEDLCKGALKLVSESSPVGFVPDWASWKEGAYAVDNKNGNVGSYDAIRVYLWAGMLAKAEPLRASLLAAIEGPAKMLRGQGQFSEKVDTTLGVGYGPAPVGYAGALLPYLKTLGKDDLAAGQAQLIARGSQGPRALPYYERILILFGKGWIDGRFSFTSAGRLQPSWEKSCPNANR